MNCIALTSSQKPETNLWSASVLILCQLCSKQASVYVCEFKCMQRMNESQHGFFPLFCFTSQNCRPLISRSDSSSASSWIECQEGQGKSVWEYIHMCSTAMYSMHLHILRARDNITRPLIFVGDERKILESHFSLSISSLFLFCVFSIFASFSFPAQYFLKQVVWSGPQRFCLSRLIGEKWARCKNTDNAPCSLPRTMGAPCTGQDIRIHKHHLVYILQPISKATWQRMRAQHKSFRSKGMSERVKEARWF